MDVLEEYASGVETMGEEDISNAITHVLGQMKGTGETVNAGTVMKKLFAMEGPLEGKPVEKKEVARLVSSKL